MEFVWLAILICSIFLLAVTIFKSKIRLKWLGYVLVNIIIAAVILYAINLTDILGDYRIPINLVTVTTIGILGLPGLVLLVAVKFFLI